MLNVGSMGFFESLFKKKRSRLYSIQLNDIEISKEISRLISKVGLDIDSLRSILASDNMTAKFAKMAELESSFRLIKIKLEAIDKDLREIRSIEVQNKDFVYLNDEDYLKDKLFNVSRMIEVLDRLLDLVSERPSSSDLRSEYLEYIRSNMGVIEESFNSVVSDDKQLVNVYSKIDEL